MKDDANIVILKDIGVKDRLKSVYMNIDKFNDNYHKFVSNTDNKFFVIPVSNIENLFFILPRECLPPIFEKRSIFYTIEVLRRPKYSVDETIFSKEICVNLEKPHQLFTFLYNLIELVIFNLLFNTKCEDGDIFAYTVTSFRTSDGIKCENTSISSFEDAILAMYDMHPEKIINYVQETIVSYINTTFILTQDKECHIVTKDLYNKLCKIKSEYISSICLQANIPLYTFVSREDAIMICDSDKYKLSKVASIEMGYGAAFAVDDWTDLSDNSFSQMRVSKTMAYDLNDFVIYLKMGKSLTRIIRNLLTMPVKFDPFESMKPYFSYNIMLNAEATNNKKSDSHKFKDYIVTKDSVLYTMDPYEDFMRELVDWYIPF